LIEIRVSLRAMTEQGRTGALSPEGIREHWSDQVTQHGLGAGSSWSDLRAIELEVATISRFLTPCLDVLDAGCGTGYSSCRYAEETGVSVVGVDYVPLMVDYALERRGGLPADVRKRLAFRVGDVRSLEFAERSFDRVISTRVVINLGAREEQRHALHEFVRVLRPGGLLLLSEATVQGWQRLNTLRGEWGLPPIDVPAHNLYLDEQHIDEDAGSQLELETVVNFASSYFVATRVLKPLLARAASINLDVADPSAEFNRWAAQLPPAGDYGTQKLFVFRKRA
jgi:ubiquinone/menaquinone biosynthesis C-methylase UbiE